MLFVGTKVCDVLDLPSSANMDEENELTFEVSIIHVLQSSELEHTLEGRIRLLSLA